MAVPTLFSQLSTTASSNDPADSEAVSQGDDHLRQIYAFIRSLYDDKVDATDPTTFSATVTVTGLTASRVVVTDANKNLASSAVTNTELGYVSGVTSAVQTQLDAKLATATAASTYQTQAGMTSYMPKSGGAFSGGITGTTAGFSGALTAASLQATSSREIKQNIRPVSPGALERVLAWNVSEYELKANPSESEVGLIAEDADERISTGKAIKTNVALFELAAAVQELARKVK